MKILLDECVPRPLRKLLPKYEVVTVQEAGWAGIENGDLLRVAEGQSTHSSQPTKICVISRNWLRGKSGLLNYRHQIGLF